MRGDPNLGVGEDKAAHEIALQIALDRDSERLLHQTAPRLARSIINIEPSSQLFFRYQWLQHCVPDVRGKNAG